MKFTLEIRKQTPSHTDVAVFVNGAQAGVLTLRNEEVDAFHRLFVMHERAASDLRVASLAEFEAALEADSLAPVATHFLDEGASQTACGLGGPLSAFPEGWDALCQLSDRWTFSWERVSCPRCLEHRP